MSRPAASRLLGVLFFHPIYVYVCMYAHMHLQITPRALENIHSHGPPVVGIHRYFFNEQMQMLISHYTISFYTHHSLSLTLTLCYINNSPSLLSTCSRLTWINHYQQPTAARIRLFVTIKTLCCHNKKKKKKKSLKLVFFPFFTWDDRLKHWMSRWYADRNIAHTTRARYRVLE